MSRWFIFSLLLGGRILTEKNCSYLEVELINDIIEQAVKHGGDPGGPHRQNSEDLIKAVNKLLQYIGLSDKYKVCDVSKESCFDGWSEIKIVAKKKGGISNDMCKTCFGKCN